MTSRLCFAPLGQDSAHHTPHTTDIVTPNVNAIERDILTPNNPDQGMLRLHRQKF